MIFYARDYSAPHIRAGFFDSHTWRGLDLLSGPADTSHKQTRINQIEIGKPLLTASAFTFRIMVSQQSLDIKRPALCRFLLCWCEGAS